MVAWRSLAMVVPAWPMPVMPHPLRGPQALASVRDSDERESAQPQTAGTGQERDRDTRGRACVRANGHGEIGMVFFLSVVQNERTKEVSLNLPIYILVFLAIAVLIVIWFNWWFWKRRQAEAARELSEIIGRDDASGKPVTRADLLKDLNADYKRFSGNSHDRRVQRRAHGRQEKTPLS